MRGEPFAGPLPKPQRGSAILTRAQRKADAAKVERDEKAKAKAWAQFRCRWPEAHVCRGGPLEAAHIVDASLGGPMAAANFVTLCPWLHRRGPESLHGKQLKVECETERGAYGPLSFWRKGEDGEFYLVAREVRPFQIGRD